MSPYYMAVIGLLLVAMIIWHGQKKKKAVIAHRAAYAEQKKGKEMKALAEKFIGKDCLVYTMASNTEAEKGILREVTESGLLLENEGNYQAINLEYVTRIREWPKNAKGKKKSIFV